VLAWLDLPGTPYGGLVFEHIDGDTFDWYLSRWG
jgi:hypothetical protein